MQTRLANLLTVVLGLLAFMLSNNCYAQTVSVTIRLINGKNGKPIKDEQLNVFLNGSRFTTAYRADGDGVIRLNVDANDTLSFLSNIQVTCHVLTTDEQANHRLNTYHVSEIVKSGIVDSNSFNKKIRTEPRRGEFIYYERPRTLWEWMAL